MRKAAIVTLLALSLSIPAAPALAAPGSKAPSVSKASHAKPAKPTTPVKPVTPVTPVKPVKPVTPVTPVKPATPVKVQFVAAGQMVSADAAAGTLTFQVQGGKDKALRQQLLTVSVDASTVIRRNGSVVTLADVLAGDHVNISGLRTATAYTATRVSVDGPITPVPVESV